MITLVISDTHFGVKNNSITWLKSQLAGIDEIIEYVRSCNDIVEIVHCGDLFDSRSSINPYIAYSVQSKINELAGWVQSINILGGNHDYYSPEERGYNINSIQFLNFDSNINIITQHEYAEGDRWIAIPWFRFHNAESLSRITQNIDPSTIIFTHTDLSHPYDELRPIINKINNVIISGHIHTPNLKRSDRLTVGSCFALDFNDANSERGFYTYKNDDISTLQFHPLNNTIRFYRLYNQEVFDFQLDTIRNHDHIEIYIEPEYNTDITYKDRINEISTISDVRIIINSRTSIDEAVSVEKFDIDDIISDSIPEHLKDKFMQLKMHISNDKQY